MNLAEIVKGAVTVEDVLRLLSIRTSPRKRIPCPIHQGEHNNFAYNDNYFVCFSCGAKGDIFTLLKELKGMDFAQALRYLNEQFRLDLPINGELSKADIVRSAKAEFLRKKQLREEKNRLDIAENEYWDAYGRLVELDRIIEAAKPKNLDDDISDEYADAVKERTKVREALDDAEIRWGWLR